MPSASLLAEKPIEVIEVDLTLEIVAGVAFASLLGVAVFTDVRYRMIPNEACLGILALGSAFAVVVNGVGGLGDSLLGVLLGFTAFVPFYAVGRMGAGDVKLMAASGAFLGPVGALNAVLFALLVGGLVGVLVLAARSATYFMPRLYSFFPQTNVSQNFKIELPYGMAIAAGSTAALWFTPVHLGIFGI